MQWMTRKAMQYALMCAAACGAAAASAQISHDTVRIGVLGDMTGMYAGSGGPGTALGVRMAVEDFGGQVNGKPIEVVVADDQNKPDVGSNIARRWIENEGIDTVVMASTSSIALNVSSMVKQHDKVMLISGSGTADLTGKACSPTNFQFVFDTYMLPKAGVSSLMSKGFKTFYFITVDYTFGANMQAEATKFIEAAGGKVLGSVKHPMGTSDFSSFLLQAQASKADAIVILNAGMDTANTIKQAKEYRITQSGTALAVFGLTINTVVAMGLDTAQGLRITTPFYWGRNAETKAWSERFMAKNNGVIPTQHNAGAYSAVTHYLKAIEVVNSDAGSAVAAQMKTTPVNDFQMKNVPIRADGQVMRPVYSVQIKAPGESTGPNDLYTVLEELPAESVWRPLAEGGCDFVGQGK